MRQIVDRIAYAWLSIMVLLLFGGIVVITNQLEKYEARDEQRFEQETKARGELQEDIDGALSSLRQHDAVLDARDAAFEKRMSAHEQRQDQLLQDSASSISEGQNSWKAKTKR